MEKGKKISTARTEGKAMDDAFEITIVTTRQLALPVTFILSKHGIENITIREIKDRKLCSQCGGTGNQLMEKYQKCEKCKGTGLVRK